MRQMNIVIQVGDMIVVNPSESTGVHLKPYKCTDIPTSAKNKLGQDCADFNDHPDFKWGIFSGFSVVTCINLDYIFVWVVYCDNIRAAFICWWWTVRVLVIIQTLRLKPSWETCNDLLNYRFSVRANMLSFTHIHVMTRSIVYHLYVSDFHLRVRRST